MTMIDTPYTYFRTGMLQHFHRRTATLTKRGPLGARTITVEWRPLPIRHIDGAHENMSQAPVFFLDQPPVFLTVSQETSAVVLRTVLTTFEGDSGSAAVEATRIDDPGAVLDFGEYRITEDTDH